MKRLLVPLCLVLLFLAACSTDDAPGNGTDAELVPVTIRLDVEKAWIEFQLSEVVLQTARKRVEAALVHSDMARQRFLNGIGTSLEVQESLSNLNDARNSYVVATYDRDLSFAAIEHSVGCDFPDRRLEITPQLLEIPTPEGERP